MRTAVLAASLVFITLNGSCAVIGAPAAKGGDAETPKADPRFTGIPLAHHATLNLLEKEQPHMMASWFKLREMYAELNVCSTLFGLRERQQARGKIPGLETRIKTELAKFYTAHDKARAPVEKEEGRLKERAIKLSETGDQSNPLISKQLDELYAAANVLSDKLDAYKELQGAFKYLRKPPDDLDHLGLNTRDATARKVALDNPKLIETRLTIMDCEADLARLAELKAAMEKDPAKRWGSAHEAAVKRAQLDLDKVVGELEKEVARAKLPFTRDAEKWKTKVEDIQKKIAALEKSKRETTAYDQRLSECMAEQENAEKAAALIDQLAAWKKPEQKPEQKPDAQKPAPKK